MAFYKKCEGTVSKCSKCNSPGIIQVKGVWYCQSCVEKDKPKKSKPKKDN